MKDSPRSLKIEMVLPTLYPAGMEVMAARLTRALTGRGHEVGITCLESGGALADELIGEGYRVTVVPAPGFRSNLYAAALEKWFQRLRPDVAHVHSGVWLKAARAARRAGVPCVVHTAHGLPEREAWYLPVLARLAARFTDYVVAVSEPLRAYIAQQATLDVQRIRVIPNGADTDRFSPGPRTRALRTALAIDNECAVIGNVARLDPVKNHELLLDAFALLRARVPDATLVIVGDGALRGTLARRIAALGLDSRVHLVGSVGDVAQVYRDFDLFVLSSRGEGTSMSVLEAMSSGVCVIATAVGGTPDVLDHGRCGQLVRSDPTDLACAIETLLRDSRRRRNLAAAARERVVTHYSQTAMVDAYEDLYYSRLPHRSRAREFAGRTG